MKIYSLEKQLDGVTDEQLALNVTPVICFEGVYVRRALLHYSKWFLTLPFEICWSTLKELYWSNYIEQILAQSTVYDPTKNYNYTETKTRTTDDGDETKTRTPDETKNYIETTNTYNHTKTTAAGTGNNAPKLDTYNLAYDTEPKHTGYTVQSGETTETETTNGTGDKVKTVDNLKYTETKSHTPTTKTIDNASITADKIEHETIKKDGYINANIGEAIKEKIELHKISYIDEFIKLFISKYAFYVGGDESDFEFV